MRFRAKLHDRLRCLAVAWVAWLEARGHVQDDEEDDDELLVADSGMGDSGSKLGGDWPRWMDYDGGSHVWRQCD